jgi:hypothetical protein
MGVETAGVFFDLDLTDFIDDDDGLDDVGSLHADGY